MAVLADANSSTTGSSGTAIYANPVALNTAKAVFNTVGPVPHPTPGLNLIMLGPVGGARG